MPETPHPDYDDSYPTCIETCSMLRVFSDDLDPDAITKLLQLEPTAAYRKGDTHNKGKLRRKVHGWFYSPSKVCASKDTRRHIDLILKALDGKAGPVNQLHLSGCKLDITSFWVSAGQGGPWLMPQQMLKLGSLGIAAWWDIYFETEDEASRARCTRRRAGATRHRHPPLFPTDTHETCE
jgi:hypothetical protein